MGWFSVFQSILLTVWIDDVRQTGTVSAYNMSTGRHNILYDDNDDREYNLLLKDFVFIKPGSGGVRDD